MNPTKPKRTTTTAQNPHTELTELITQREESNKESTMLSNGSPINHSTSSSDIRPIHSSSVSTTTTTPKNHIATTTIVKPTASSAPENSGAKDEEQV